jgi:hypothetical protein
MSIETRRFVNEEAVDGVPDSPKVHVKVDNWEGDFDEKIAPLIAEIWKADIGITTRYEQDNGCGQIDIEFMSFDDLTTFMYILVGSTKGPDLLRDHMVGTNCDLGDSWSYDLWPDDYADICEDDYAIGWLPSVQFPFRDLPCVLYRLQRHNAGAGDVDAS